MLKTFVNKIPEFCMSHWLLRIPLIIVFLQQGIDKLPIDPDAAAAYELTLLVWTFVVLGEIGGGLGLIVGGLLSHAKNWLKEVGDLITRFSGITLASIMTGVIWTFQPENLFQFMVDDPFHVMLWVGGMFFALRGNRT